MANFQSNPLFWTGILMGMLIVIVIVGIILRPCWTTLPTSFLRSTTEGFAVVPGVAAVNTGGTTNVAPNPTTGTTYWNIRLNNTTGPVVFYDGENYTGVARTIPANGEIQVPRKTEDEFWIKSIRIPVGYEVKISVTRNNKKTTRVFTGDQPSIRFWEDNLTVVGVKITYGTRDSISVSANKWGRAMEVAKRQTSTSDWYEVTDGNLKFKMSYSNGIRGIYVAFYNAGYNTPRDPRPFAETNGDVAFNQNDIQGHFSSDILSKIDFDTINVFVDVIGDGHSGQTMEVRKSTNPTLFNLIRNDVFKMMEQYKNTKSWSPLTADGKMFEGSRYMSIWVEKRDA